MFLEAGLTPEESIRSVHVTQDMICHRAIKPPEKLMVTATVTALERRSARNLRAHPLRHPRHQWRAGLDDQLGTAMARRRYDGTRAARRSRRLPVMRAPDGAVRASFHIPIAATAAIVYTACARADNQVSFHTDTAAANRSGLRAPLLMGVATLAMSVSRIIESEAAGDPERVARSLVPIRRDGLHAAPN